jgi:hypothetical protein
MLRPPDFFFAKDKKIALWSKDFLQIALAIEHDFTSAKISSEIKKKSIRDLLLRMIPEGM